MTMLNSSPSAPRYDGQFRLLRPDLVEAIATDLSTWAETSSVTVLAYGHNGGNPTAPAANGWLCDPGDISFTYQDGVIVIEGVDVWVLAGQRTTSVCRLNVSPRPAEEYAGWIGRMMEFRVNASAGETVQLIFTPGQIRLTDPAFASA